VTFYSYKGGTGRTMALANIAALLARRGKKVLVVDFDLEAPGLCRYFEQYRPGLAEERGLIDLLTDAMPRHRTSHVDWRDYVTTVPFESGEIAMITSGRLDERYAAKVLSLDWTAFFRESKGGEFMRMLRSQWQSYDFTLIDSRTGVTDAGGICTIMLPDMLVPFFTPNAQSLEGIVEVMTRAQEKRDTLPYDQVPARILPILSRFDATTEFDRGQEWLDRSATRLRGFYSSWLPTNCPPRLALERTKLPYVPYFSFGEELAVLLKGASDPTSLGYALNVVSLLIEENLQNASAIIGTQVPVAPTMLAEAPTPGQSVSYDRAVSGGITILGPAGSGKGTFAAALPIALTSRSEQDPDQRWNLVGADPKSVEALVELGNGLTAGHAFPRSSGPAVEDCRFLLTGEVSRTVKRRFRPARRTKRLIKIDLAVADTVGIGRARENGLAKQLAESRGIVFLFDPTGQGDPTSDISAVLADTAQLMARLPEFASGLLPHYVAVCISKFDDRRVLDTAKRLSVLTRDPSDHYDFPRVGGEDAREFFLTLSAATSRNDSHLIINELERYFQRDRISYFVTSAIGFKVDAGTNKFDADYPENYEQAGRGFRIRNGVHPINVAEPVLWLSDRIAGDPGYLLAT
jgi:cellulose biosynthesis protein BcsQ